MDGRPDRGWQGGAFDSEPVPQQPSGAFTGEILPPVRRAGSHAGEPDGSGERVWASAEVGDFRQGSTGSRWALSRYLVGRAVAEAVGTTLLVIAALILVLAAVSEWAAHWTALAVLLFVFALAVALLRAALLGTVRRFTAIDRGGVLGGRVDALVSDTNADVRHELRRVGLPSRSVTMPLIAMRILGRRRADTLRRMRDIDIDRLVPAARLDELHLLLRDRDALAAPHAAPPPAARVRRRR